MHIGRYVHLFLLFRTTKLEIRKLLASDVMGIQSIRLALLAAHSNNIDVGRGIPTEFSTLPYKIDMPVNSPVFLLFSHPMRRFGVNFLS